METSEFNSPDQTLSNPDALSARIPTATSSERSLSTRATAAAGMNTGACEPKRSLFPRPSSTSIFKLSTPATWDVSA